MGESQASARDGPGDSYLSQQLHTEILQGDSAIHLLLLLQEQHEEPPFHVSQQIPRSVGIHTVVAHNGALLQRKQGILGFHSLKLLPKRSVQVIQYPTHSRAPESRLRPSGTNIPVYSHKICSLSFLKEPLDGNSSPLSAQSSTSTMPLVLPPLIKCGKWPVILTKPTSPIAIPKSLSLFSSERVSNGLIHVFHCLKRNQALPWNCAQTMH